MTWLEKETLRAKRAEISGYIRDLGSGPIKFLADQLIG